MYSFLGHPLAGQQSPLPQYSPPKKNVAQRKPWGLPTSAHRHSTPPNQAEQERHEGNMGTNWLWEERNPATLIGLLVAVVVLVPTPSMWSLNHH